MNARDLLAERLAKPVTEAPLNQYTSDLVEGVVEHWTDINELLSTYSQGWTLERMPSVDRAILRLGAFEVLYATEVPENVAIAEAVELAKSLSTDDSPSSSTACSAASPRSSPPWRERPTAGRSGSRRPTTCRCSRRSRTPADELFPTVFPDVGARGLPDRGRARPPSRGCRARRPATRSVGFAQADPAGRARRSWSRSPCYPAHGRRGLGWCPRGRGVPVVAADGHDRAVARAPTRTSRGTRRSTAGTASSGCRWPTSRRG